MRSRIISLALPIVLVVGVAAAATEDAGHIKVSKGAVQIERSGQRLAAPVGQTLWQAPQPPQRCGSMTTESPLGVMAEAGQTSRQRVQPVLRLRE